MSDLSAWQPFPPGTSWDDGGAAPRAVGEGEMARLHGHLLSLLMVGGQP